MTAFKQLMAELGTPAGRALLKDLASNRRVYQELLRRTGWTARCRGLNDLRREIEQAEDAVNAQEVAEVMDL